MTLFATGASHVGFVVGEPAGATTDNLDALLPGAEVVAVGSSRGGELNRHFRAAEGIGVEIFFIVHINDADNLVSTVEGDFFNHAPHFPVANQCNFHKGVYKLV